MTSANHKIDGDHFDVDGAKAGNTAHVRMHSVPLPTGTLRLRVFKDTAPVDGTYEVDVEQPLSGFVTHLNDVFGEVTTDWFGNRLCTNYVHDGAGQVVFGADGTPEIDTANPGGLCLSDSSGDVAIPNIGPDRYTASVIAPTGEKWYQTTTLEGNHDWDMWISENETGFDTEQTVGGEPVPPVDMGYVPFAPNSAVTSVTIAGTNNFNRTATLTFASDQAPATPPAVGSTITVANLAAVLPASLLTRIRIAGLNGDHAVSASTATTVSFRVGGGNLGATAVTGLVAAGRDAAPLPLTGNKTITGSVVIINTYVGGTGGVDVPNAGVAGANVRGPIKEPIVTLSDLGNNDQMVYVGRGGTDGKFTIPKVPAGSYQLTVWDFEQEYILDSFNVTVNPTDTTVDIGQKGIVGWYADIRGTVFVDSNGNGKRDPGEQGVPGFPIAVKYRDNSALDAGQNATTTVGNGPNTGAYDVTEGYPISKWFVLEFFNTRYKTTGITVQADNEPTEKTYLGAGVDLNVLPIIGLSGRVDIGVQSYAGKENGGIVGTVSYDTTRNELDPAYAVSEGYQPGIPGLTVHLYAPVECDPSSDPTTAPGSSGVAGVPDGSVCNETDFYWHKPNGAVQPRVDGGGAPVDMADPYTTETWNQSTNCVPRQFDGKEVDQWAIPTSAINGSLTAAGKDPLCVEAPMSGWQAVPADYDKVDGSSTPIKDANGNYTNFGQMVNGNYGFGTITHDPITGDAVDPETPISNGDWLVAVDIPKVGGQPLYKPTQEEDVNVFDGDTRLPQENFPAAKDAPVVPPTGLPDGSGGGVSQGGIVSPCAGASHTVVVKDQAFVDAGGSPFENQDRPLCDTKLVTLRGGQAVAPNFNLFTEVPLPTHFWGLTINDLGLSQDKTQAGYGEAQPLPNVPMGIYDWSGRLVDTVNTDWNGMYEALEPSTSSYNCPLPAGPCPGMYYFKGNDPGQPGHVNANYNPRFRTIGTEFQAWPGLWTVTDTAPTQVGVIAVAPGATGTTPVDCGVNAGVTATATDAKATPDIMSVSTPYMNSSTVQSGGTPHVRRTIAITGRDQRLRLRLEDRHADTSAHHLRPRPHNYPYVSFLLTAPTQRD